MRSVALLVEADGDGARLCEALAVCADEGVGVAVLKVGASERGRAAAAAHTGAVAGDHRVFRALMEEAGAAWAADVHELLELAKALAVRDARPRGGGLAILTCSGGDSGLGADEADRLGLDLPAAVARHGRALRARLPAAATVANPLDYTAMIWGEVETLRDLVRTVGEDPAIDHVLVFYDRPPGIAGHARRELGRGRGGDPGRRRGEPGAGDGRRDAAGAARRRGGLAILAAPGCRRSPGLRTGVAVAAALADAAGSFHAGCARSRRTRVARRPAAGSRSTRRRRSFGGAACPSWLDGLH